MKSVFIALCLLGSTAFAGIAEELHQVESPQYREAERNKEVLHALNHSLKKFDLKITRVQHGQWAACALNMEAQINAVELSDGRKCWVMVRAWGGLTSIGTFEGVFACYRGKTPIKGYEYTVELGKTVNSPLKKVTSKVSDRSVEESCY
jgi:hypothetical protein